MTKKSIRSTAYILLFSFLITFNAQAQNQALSVDQVLALFYQRNLDLIAAQYNIEQSVADAIIASAIPNPTIGFQLLELSRNLNNNASATGCPQNTSCGPAQYYSFSQLIEVAGKRGLRIQSSGFATQAAESDFRDAIRIFSNMVRDTYYQLPVSYTHLTLPTIYSV